MSAQPTTLLIANRGEIALRILRAGRKLGMRVVCVHSEADRDARYISLADMSICIGPAPAAKSYLNVDAILAAAELAEADLIHPGYGFLSESASFADAVVASGRTFVGPSGDAMRLMGDKISAKKAMRAAGVPCVPGPEGALPTQVEAIAVAAEEVGYPVILKAAGGGGGRGMRIVRTANELASAALLTRQEAGRFFGTEAIYMEKFLENPRNVEIQVIADQSGHALWVGDRDCSMQRRHQKVIEEAPAPGIDRALITEIGDRCAAACREIGYVGAGTFEFLYEDGNFYFIEMNTRIQVEHPVTEMVTGLDLVALQLEVALGRNLPLRQEDIQRNGHAMEFRINAEDPHTFAPSPGRIDDIHFPGGPGLRIESHAEPGYRVPENYDSMIGKLVVHAADRAEVLIRARAALEEILVSGIKSNVPLHREILADPGFISGGVSIHHMEAWLAERSSANG